MDKSIVRQEIDLRYSGEASHISWCRVSNLVAISFKADRESEVKICVLEPSQPNLTVTLRVPLKDSTDHLVTLQWSHVGCKRVLLAVTRSGSAVAWLQTKPDSDATQTVRTLDEWYGHQVFQLDHEVVDAMWLTEPAAIQWNPPSPDEDFRKQSIDTLFVPQESEEEEDFKVLNSYWVRPGLLCIAVMTTDLKLQFWWLPMGAFANQMVWKKSIALDLAPYLGAAPSVVCMAAITTYAMGVRVAVGLNGDSSLVKILRVAGDPTFLDGSGEPLYTSVVDEVVDVPTAAGHSVRWLRWLETLSGTSLLVCSEEVATGNAQVASFSLPASNFIHHAPGSCPTSVQVSQQAICTVPAQSSDALLSLNSSPSLSHPPHPLAMSHDGHQLLVSQGPDLQLLVMTDQSGIHVGERLHGAAGSASGSTTQNGTLRTDGDAMENGDAQHGGTTGSGRTTTGRSHAEISRCLAEFSPNACCLCVVYTETRGRENTGATGAGRRSMTQQTVLRLWCLKEPHVPGSAQPNVAACTAVRCTWSWAHAHSCWDVVHRMMALGEAQPKWKLISEVFGVLDLLIAGLTEHVKPRAAYYLDRLKLQVVQGINHPDAARLVIEIKARMMMLTLERIFGMLAHHKEPHSQDKHKRYLPNDLMAALPWVQWGVDFFWLYFRIVHRFIIKLRQSKAKGKVENEPLPLIRFMGDVYLHRRLTMLLSYLIQAASQVRKHHVKAPGGYAEVLRMMKVINLMFRWCVNVEPETQGELAKLLETNKEPHLFPAPHMIKALQPIHALWVRLEQQSHVQHKELTEKSKGLSDGEVIGLMQEKATEAVRMFPSELDLHLHPYRTYGPISHKSILELCSRWNESLPIISDLEIQTQLRHLGLSKEDRCPSSTRLALLAAHQRFRNDAPLPPPPGICRLGVNSSARVADEAATWRDQIQVSLGQASRTVSRWRRDVITMRSLGVGDSSHFELLDGSGTTMEYEPHVLSQSVPAPQSFMNHWRRAWLIAGPFSGSSWKRTRHGVDEAASHIGEGNSTKRFRS